MQEYHHEPLIIEGFMVIFVALFSENDFPSVHFLGYFRRIIGFKNVYISLQ